MPRPEPGLMSASNVENIVSNEVRRTQWVARQDTLITNHHHQIFGGFSTATVRRSHYPPPLIPCPPSYGDLPLHIGKAWSGACSWGRSPTLSTARAPTSLVLSRVELATGVTP